MRGRSNKGMHKTIKCLLIIAVVVALVCLGMWLWPMTSWANYYAVAVETGDIYFGKISHFPCLQLRNVWYLQQTGDQDNPYSLVKFTDLRWSPEDRLNLNYKYVVWMVKLDKKGQVATFLKNPVATQQNAPQQGASADLESVVPGEE
jgi:hypothetical protein